MNIAADSRVVRGAIAVASLALVVLVARPERRHRELFTASELAEVQAQVDAMRAIARTAPCPRPPLREPGTGDGAPLLWRLLDKTSPEARCLDGVWKRRQEQTADCGADPCPDVSLASETPRPDLVEACAPLYATIERFASTEEACSPLDAERGMNRGLDGWLAVHNVADAVRLQILPIVERGDLATATRHVVEAMRFVDDYSRRALLPGSLASFVRLADTLAELLADPRLTAAGAAVVARDLEILQTSPPEFADMIREEAVWHQQRRSEPSRVVGDLDQDRALRDIVYVRWVNLVDETCRGKPLSSCVDQLSSRLEVAHDYELHDILDSGDESASIRERLVDRLVRVYAVYIDSARRLGAREHALLAVRIQAELRMMPLDECLHPIRRHDRLAPWLIDAGTLNLGPDPFGPTLTSPAWQVPRVTRALYCVP